MIIGSAFAERPLQVSEAQLTNHLAQSVEPVYPQASANSEMKGTVVVLLTLSAEGKVVELKAISGPQQLRLPATDAIRQWQFRPFRSDGHVVPASGEISLEFFAGREDVVRRDREIFARYSAQEKLCFEATIRVGGNYADTVAPCMKTAEIANEFAPNMRFFERINANTKAAWVLENTQKSQDALLYADRAVDIAQQGRIDDSGCASAYQVRAEIRFDLRDLKGAEEDFSTAINYNRKALKLAQLQKSATISNLESGQKSLQERHSRVLAQMGKPKHSAKHSEVL